MDEGQTLTMLKAWTTWPTPTPPHSASESSHSEKDDASTTALSVSLAPSLAPHQPPQPPRRNSAPPSLVPALGETPMPLLVLGDDVPTSIPAAGFLLLGPGVEAHTLSSQDSHSSTALDSHKDSALNDVLLSDHHIQIEESSEPEKLNCYTFPHSRNAILPTISATDPSDSSQFMGNRQGAKVDSRDVPSRECIDTLALTPNLASFNTSPSPSSYSAQALFPPSLPSICVVDMRSPEGVSDDLFLSSAVAPNANLLHPTSAHRNLSASSTSLIPTNAYNFSDSISCISSDQEDDSDDDEVLFLDQTMRDGGSASSSDLLMDLDEPVIDEISFSESVSFSANVPGNLSIDEFDAGDEDDDEGFIGGHSGILPSGPPQAPKPPIRKPVPVVDLDATSTDSSGSDSETSASGSSGSGSSSDSDIETEDAAFPFFFPLLPVLNGSSPIRTKRIKLVLKPSPPLPAPTSAPNAVPPAPTPAIDPRLMAHKPRRATAARTSSLAEGEEDNLAPPGPTAPRRAVDGGAFVPRKPLGRPPGRPLGTRGRPSVDGLTVPFGTRAGAFPPPPPPVVPVVAEREAVAIPVVAKGDGRRGRRPGSVVIGGRVVNKEDLASLQLPLKSKPAVAVSAVSRGYVAASGKAKNRNLKGRPPKHARPAEIFVPTAEEMEEILAPRTVTASAALGQMQVELPPLSIPPMEMEMAERPVATGVCAEKEAEAVLLSPAPSSEETMVEFDVSGVDDKEGRREDLDSGAIAGPVEEEVRESTVVIDLTGRCDQADSDDKEEAAAIPVEVSPEVMEAVPPVLEEKLPVREKRSPGRPRKTTLPDKALSTRAEQISPKRGRRGDPFVLDSEPVKDVVMLASDEQATSVNVVEFTEAKEKLSPETRMHMKTRAKDEVEDPPSPLSSADGSSTPPRSRSTAKSTKRKRGRPSEVAVAVTETKCILKAYSKVEVWECILDSVSVMRRHADGWLNATQLLKVAGITEKSRRTKILEACHLEGPCEKVQGGFGKYQGTWVPVDKAVEICKQYGIEERLEPLFACECKPNSLSRK